MIILGRILRAPETELCGHRASGMIGGSCHKYNVFTTNVLWRQTRICSGRHTFVKNYTCGTCVSGPHRILPRMHRILPRIIIGGSRNDNPGQDSVHPGQDSVWP